MSGGASSSQSALRLRALAHPLRWKLMDLVRSEDSATATRCSQVLGESVASCAYHLGILGKYGYLEQIRDRPGREKPWRAVDGWQDLSAIGDSVEEQLASDAASAAFLEHEFERIKSRRRVMDSEPEDWKSASWAAGTHLWVTAAELEEIKRDLLAVMERYGERAENPPLRPQGARHARVFFSTSVQPRS